MYYFLRTGIDVCTKTQEDTAKFLLQYGEPTKALEEIHVRVQIRLGLEIGMQCDAHGKVHQDIYKESP